MSILKGWNLTGRLVAKHFGALGDNLASMIASFDPETATEADRDALKAKLQDVGARYHEAKLVFDKEAADVVALQAQIASDTNIASGLAARLEARQIEESTALLFCEELEAAKARLPQEIQEEADARAFMEEIKSIMDEMSDRLAKFDKAAAEARRALAQAQAQVELQETRQAQQEDLRALRGEGGSTSSALAALQNRATKLANQAQGMKVVTDVLDKPAQDAARVAKLRTELAGGAPTSTLDRLKALSASAAQA
jgi:chromosome segregation ATPase